MGLAYFLWLVGGFLGLHHFYLGRDLQGFLWWSTLGGYFGCGWLRDLFLIPQYVKDANNDSQYLAKLSEKMRTNKVPPFSTSRFTGMVIVGYLFGSVVSSAIPLEEAGGIDWQFLQILVPLGCALGVWCVGNIGHEEGSLIWPVLAAYAAYPVYRYYGGDISFSLIVIAASYMFDWKSKQWRRRITHKKSLVKRTAMVSTCAIIYLSLWGCNMYFNGVITDAYGDQIPISEAIHHFFTSPWWTDLGRTIVDTIEYAKHHGWEEVWKMVIELSDPHGENNAFKVLELDSSANQTLINSRCRQLSVKWHPDKIKDTQMKAEAQEKFYEVQQACELLSTSKAKRRRNNKKST
ncbi:hypothetical protein AAG570_012154 [Ranatra chinensis]|uniref:DnaJ homolog subfamily C member 22 n=1 Tax=Ranatra chinensis TaxID=642074 RepID=A0ABD0Z4A8_9HEMI